MKSTASKNQPDYSYQPSIIKDCIAGLIAQKQFVMAGAPGAGKTRMVYEIINKMLKAGQIKNALVFTHGTRVLREQWLEVSENLKIKDVQEIKEKTKKIHSKIVLALPHSFRVLEKKKFDLIVIDEAHHFFFASMIQNFLENQPNAFILSVTGSPNKFINRGWDFSGITISEMMDHKVCVDPLIELCNTGYKFDLKDYDKDYTEFKKREKLDETGTYKSMDLLMDHVMEKHGKSISVFMQDTMIAAYSKNQAIWISKWLTNHGIRHITCIENRNAKYKVLHETSETLDDFKNKKVRTAIVVNRGIIGFDFPDMTHVVDMTFTLNPFRSFQLLCRLVRKSQNKKVFIKMTPDTMKHIHYHTMCFAVALSVPEFYWMPIEIKTTGYQGMDIFADKKFIKSAEQYNKGEITLDYYLENIPAVPSFEEFRKGIKLGIFAKTNFDYIAGIKRVEFVDLKTLLEKALSYTNIFQLRQKDPVLYKTIRQRIGAPKIYALFGMKYEAKSFTWNKTKARAEIKRLNPKNRYALKTAHISLYKWCLKNDREYLDKLLPTSHVNQWTKEKVIKKMKENESFSKFRRSNDGAHKFMLKNYPEEYKELKEKHFHTYTQFGKAKIKWTIKEIWDLIETKKIRNMNHLKRKYPGAYGALCKRLKKHHPEVSKYFQKRL